MGSFWCFLVWVFIVCRYKNKLFIIISRHSQPFTNQGQRFIISMKCEETVPWLCSPSFLQLVCVPTVTLVTTLPSNAWIVRYSHELTLEPVLYYKISKPKHVHGVSQAPVPYITVQYLPCNKYYLLCGKHNVNCFRLNQMPWFQLHVWSQFFESVNLWHSFPNLFLFASPGFVVESISDDVPGWSSVCIFTFLVFLTHCEKGEQRIHKKTKQFESNKNSQIKTMFCF